jgi:hypothetical protein
MNELDLLIENYFTESFETSELFRLVEQVMLTEAFSIPIDSDQDIDNFETAQDKEELKKLLAYLKTLKNVPYPIAGGTDGKFKIRNQKDNESAIKDWIASNTPSLRFSFGQGSLGKEIKPDSTKFEENLANSLNKGQDVEKYVGAGEQFDMLADQIISSIKNKKPLDGKTFEKLTGRGQLSPTYIKYGVKSREPKTDLISTDGSVRISVKKKGAQFISAQGNETAAVLMSVLQEDTDAKQKLGAIIREYFKFERGLAQIKGRSQEEREKIVTKRNFLLNRILNFGGRDLKEKIVKEATLGEYKFEDEDSVPNYFLVWTEGGEGELYTAERFIRLKLPQIRFGVRGRGGERGLSLRGET